VELILLLKGLIIGVVIAAPVGPVNLICIQHTLSEGKFKGLVSGFGATIADTFYGIVAGFGFSFVSGFLMDHITWLQYIGSVVLFAMGYRMFNRTEVRTKIPEKHTKRSLFHAFSSTFAITLTNPLTVFAFLAIYAAMGVTQTSGETFSAAILVMGVFLGSLLWWTFISHLVHLVRDRFNNSFILRVNKISGVVLFGFGFIAAGKALIDTWAFFH
jgi:threonine/homoserine/homoserine lactone efflux protein